MAAAKLNTEAIETKLNEVPEWSLKNEKLHRELKFKDFVQAWGFMTQVAMLAEQANHHPEWSNVWNNVIIDLTTHEANGISQRDFDLAKQIDKVAASMK